MAECPLGKLRVWTTAPCSTRSGRGRPKKFFRNATDASVVSNRNTSITAARQRPLSNWYVSTATPTSTTSPMPASEVMSRMRPMKKSGTSSTDSTERRLSSTARSTPSVASFVTRSARTANPAAQPRAMNRR